MTGACNEVSTTHSIRVRTCKHTQRENSAFNYTIKKYIYILATTKTKEKKIYTNRIVP